MLSFGSKLANNQSVKSS